MGCPIRKSSDQRVFAPPRRLSQRITSFIACACQGIHQLPLIHLIILIANIHQDFMLTSVSNDKHRQAWHTEDSVPGYQLKKTSFLRYVQWQRLGLPIIVPNFEQTWRRSFQTNLNTSSLHNFNKNRQMTKAIRKFLQQMIDLTALTLTTTKLV